MRGWLFALCALIGCVASVLSESPTPEGGNQPKDGKHPWMNGRQGEGNGNGPYRPGESPANAAAFENVRRALEALTPDQRKRFQENMLRWANLPPEEKKSLRDREEYRRKEIEEETNAAIKESGLQLNPERREEFIKRYTDGRRQIEEQLRQEAMEKRKPMVRDLISRLRGEFTAEGTSTTSSQTIQTSSPGTQSKP